MFCPESGKFRECPEAGCPFYLKELTTCLRALQIKKELGILTWEEKTVLKTIRKQRR
jgi:hypothetical protein